MSANPTLVGAQNTFEDPLAYLPCSPIAKYQRGEIIYHQNQPSAKMYLVISGKVKITRVADNGSEIMVDIFGTDDFFGEAALLGLPLSPEQATALENCSLMMWTAVEICSIAEIRPKLALALLQIAAQRSLDYGNRIQSFSVENIGRRLARTLIRLSERFGVAESDGSHRMGPFTRDLLAHCLGTSRELVTGYMNLFRRKGYMDYSRRGIVVFRYAIDEWSCDTGRTQSKRPTVQVLE